MKDADENRLAALVRRIEAADKMDEKIKEDKAKAEAGEQKRKTEMFAAWENALQWVSETIETMNPTLSRSNLKLAVEAPRENIGNAVARMTIVVTQGLPPARKSLTLNLTSHGTVNVVNAGVTSSLGGEYFQLEDYDRDAFVNLILKYLEALISDRETSQARKRSEMGLDKLPR